MQILSMAIRLKIDQLLSLKKRKQLENEVIQTINLAGRLTTQRSITDLIKEAKICIPEFFGFEGASILLRDVKADLLFTINEVEQNTADDEDPLRETAKVSFPLNRGVTGKVFKSLKTVYQN